MRRRVGAVAAAVLVSAGVPSLAPTKAVREGSVVVLDARTGKERWHAAPGKSGFFMGTAIGEGIVATVEYACSTSDPGARTSVQVFDAKTGRRRWKTPPDGTKLAALDVVGGNVFVQRPSQQISALDATTGEERWRFPASVTRVDTRADVVFGTATGDQPVTAYEATTGEARWTFWPKDDPDWRGQAAVVAANERVVVIASGGYSGRKQEGRDGASLPFGATTIWTLDRRTGAELAQQILEDPQFSSTNAGITDDLVVYLDGPELVGRDLIDGSIRWKFFIPGDPAEIAGLLGSLGLTFDPSSDGRTVLLRKSKAFDDPDPVETIAFDAATGDRLWKQTGWVVDSPNGYSPVGSQVTVLYDDDTRLVGLDTRGGKVLWTSPIPPSFRKRQFAARTTDKVVALSTFCDE